MKLNQLAACVAAVSFLTACGSSSDSDSAPAINMEKAEAVLSTNADIALAAYTDSVETAKALKTALATFKTTPDATNLEAAKKAWLVSREPYGQTEVYRFRNSPIDSTDYSSEDGPEGDLNAWPLGEALIDYVQTNATDFTASQVGVTANSAEINSNGVVDGTVANQNIIQSDITINAALLANTATASDEHDVIAGYHAIEFLLWGQDLNGNNGTTNGTDRHTAVNTGVAGGQRLLTDFTIDVANPASDAARRHAYLEVAVDKLIADLESVRDGWKAGADYRTAFTTIANESQAKQKLTEILTGMGTLSEGELAGERMQIAYSSNSQEDEHSCFSDNTHRDVWLNAEGVSNSFYGQYAGYDSDQNGTDDVITNKVNGYGINDYLRDVGLDSLADEAAAKFAVTETNYKAIDTKAGEGFPFDVLIMDENRNATNPVALTIIALNKQSNAIQDIATELGLGDVVDDDASSCDTTTPGVTCD
ncbi:imelysin family protein [Pseudomonas sp. HK3]